MRFVLLEILERQPAVLAVTNVENPEVDLGTFSFLVQAGMLGDSSVSRVLLAAGCAHVAVVVC